MTPFLQDGVVSAGEGVRDFDVFVRRAIDYLHRDLASLGLRSSPRDFASGGAAGVRERNHTGPVFWDRSRFGDMTTRLGIACPITTELKFLTVRRTLTIV